jgi:hypothetical protein
LNKRERKIIAIFKIFVGEDRRREKSQKGQGFQGKEAQANTTKLESGTPLLRYGCVLMVGEMCSTRQ